MLPKHKIEFDWESQIERDIEEDRGDDSVASAWLNPMSAVFDASVWFNNEEAENKRWNTNEYKRISQRGSDREFEIYWNAKMRRQKEERGTDK
jgi:hypothetical protein